LGLKVVGNTFGDFHTFPSIYPDDNSRHRRMEDNADGTSGYGQISVTLDEK